MSKLNFYSILIVFAFFQSKAPVTSAFDELTDIIGGSKIKDDSSRPYQVSLQIYGVHLCGGVIIDKEWIVTAAHCNKLPPGVPYSTYSVVSDTTDLNNPGVTKPAKLFYSHPGYTKANHSNDIALLKVDPYTFSKTQAAAKLPGADDNFSPGTKVVLSGWGELKHEGRNPKKLRIVTLEIKDQDECEKAWGEGEVYPTNICAGPTGNTRQGQCEGDSGGPLTVDEQNEDVLVGIVSWSIKDPDCGSTKYPGLYTRISKYLDWIKSIQEKYKDL